MTFVIIIVCNIDSIYAIIVVTLRRDLDLLAEKKLLKTEKGKYRANHALLYSFMAESSVSIKRHF